MISETVIVAIIVSIASPVVVKFLEFTFGMFNQSKQKEQNRIENNQTRMDAMDRQIDAMKEGHSREMAAMRISLEKDYSAKIEVLHKEHSTKIDGLHREIKELRDENVKLRILVAENAVKLTLKEEVIARLTQAQEGQGRTKKATRVSSRE